MAEHYAVMEVDQVLQTPQTNVRYVQSPLDGFLQDVYLSVGAAIPTDAIFDVMKNGVSLWAGFPANRPKILGGQSSGSKLAVNAVIAKGDILRVDLTQVPVGGLPVPFVIRFVLYDTIALRSQVIYVTPSIANLAIHNATIPNMGRGWKLYSASSDKPAWFRGYMTSAQRTADSTRDIETDASENAGLGAEVRFTDTLLSVVWGAPFPEGYNGDDPTSTDGIFSIQNRSGSTGTVQITVQKLVTER